MRQVDDDLEVVVQFLTDVPTQLGRHNVAWIGVEAMNAEVHIVFVIENTDFGLLRGCLSFERLPLQKIGNRASHLPLGIVDCAIKFRRMLNPSCVGRSSYLFGSDLVFALLRTTLSLRLEKRRSEANQYQ